MISQIKSLGCFLFCLKREGEAWRRGEGEKGRPFWSNEENLKS